MLEVISDFKCARLDVKICEGDMRLSFLMLSLSFISHIKVWVIGVLLLVNIVCVTIWSMHKDKVVIGSCFCFNDSC